MSERIWNGTVVREKPHTRRLHRAPPLKGVVISQTEHPDRVIVRWEGGIRGEWEENVWDLEVLDERPVQDGTRAYS